MPKTDVTIVIVCMNNLRNLYPCINSIKKNTSLNYETIVVAYLFSDENLLKFRNDFPWVKTIISNKLRGFSENNNLALNEAKGEYCFVLNDDTTFDTPVIDQLYSNIRNSENAVVFSPNIVNSDGSIISGRPPFTLTMHLLYNFFRINFISKKNKKYINQDNIFQTYNIQGCSFLINTEIFKSVGFFDEQYFFCPEDIALSTMLNKKGFKCFVNPELTINHNNSTTFKKTIVATYPAMQKGELIFLANGNKSKEKLLGLIMLSNYLIFIIVWALSIMKSKEIRKTNIIRYKNAFYTILSNKTPKEIFSKFYKA